MATVQQRIEVWTGEIWDTAPVYQVLQDSVRAVVGDLNPDSLTPLWVELTDSGSGVTTTSYRILEARKGLYKAVQISPSFRTAEGISEEDPVTYTLAGKTYVLPSGGTVLALTYPAVKMSDVSVTSVSEQLMTLFVLRTAEGTLHHLMQQLTLGLVETVTLPTVPTPPSAPVIAASDAAAVAPSAIAVGTAPSAPSYSSPTLAARPTNPTGTLSLAAITPPVAPAAPAIAFVDAIQGTWTASASVAALPALPTLTEATFGGDVGSVTTAVPALLDLTFDVAAAALTPPAPPSDPVLSSAGIVDVAIGSLGTAPAYTKPTFSGAIADITTALPALLDLALDVSAAALTPPALPADPSLSSVGFSGVTLAALSTAPAYTKATTTVSFTGYTTYQTAEDPEMMGAIVQKLRAELEDLDATRRDEWNEFQKEAEVYRADLQHKIEQARIASQELQTKLSQADRMALEDYAQELALYDRELALYRSKVETAVSENSANVQRAMAGVAETQRQYLQLYSLDVQNELNEFQKETEIYRSTVQKAIEQARIELSEKQSELSEANQMALQDYVQELSLYDRELALFRAKVEAAVGEVQANLARAVEGLAGAQRLWLEKYRADVEQKVSAFGGAMQDHMRECDRILEQARLDQQRLAELHSRATDLSIQNKIQTFQAAIADYQNKVELFRAKSQFYQLEVDAAVRTFAEQKGFDLRVFTDGGRLDTERYGAAVGDARNTLEANIAKHRTDMERVVLVAQIARQEAEQTASQATDVALRNKAQTLAGVLADWEVDLSLYRAQIESYVGQLKAALESRQIEQATREAKLTMLARSRDRVRQMYQEAKANFERVFVRYRPINVAFREF